MSKEHQQGVVAILTANLIFGLNIPVTKIMVTDWMTPLGYTMVRMVLGAIIFWCISSFLEKDPVKPKDLWVIMIGGLIGYLGTQILFSQALKFTSPVIFSLLMAMTPVVVLIFSALFLKEAVPARKVAGILISISGASMIIWLSRRHEAIESSIEGILYTLLCVLCYSGYMLLTRGVSVKYQPVTIAKWMFLFSAIVSIPFGIGEWSEQLLFTEQATAEAYALMAFAVIFSTTLAFFLMPVALKRLEASTVSIFMNVQPVVATVLAIAIGQDVWTWDKPIAVLLVGTGVYMVTTQRGRLKRALSRV